MVWVGIDNLFQSTHPVRGGTGGRFAEFWAQYPFQSTHPVRGGTEGAWVIGSSVLDFNPPTP